MSNCICPDNSHLGLYRVTQVDPHCPEHATAGDLADQIKRYAAETVDGFAEQLDRAMTSDLPLRAKVAEIVGLLVPKKLTVEWAMGALEEYCRKLGQPVHVVYNPDPVRSLGNKSFHVEINFKGQFADALPQAICEAIVAHAEGK